MAQAGAHIVLTALLTIDEVAARLGVDRDAVSTFIAKRELAAVNVARNRSGKRPRWRIRPEDLEAFELSRRHSNQPPSSTTRKRRQQAAGRTWF
jgi:excisionase family DNA binding protein